jgi:O-antigen/teichoic acid export membrane protein
MKVWIPKNKKELKEHLSDPLFKNAYFLMFSSLTAAGAGFFFWLIAARFYPTEDLGLASAIIAAGGLISMISLLGFDISLVRFLPGRKDKAEMINSCLTISFLVSLILALIFIAGINIWSPSLIIIRENKLILLLFVTFTAIAPMSGLQSGGIFAGFRKTEYSLYQTLVTLIRIGVVPFLMAFGSLGIYVSYGLTPVLAFLLGTFLISKIFPYKPIPSIKRGVINDIIHFSSGNYLARVFEELPTFILPIMVINVLGAETNAYFFIAWQISFLLLAIPRFTTISLLAEGSHNSEKLERDTKRAAKFIFLILIPAIAVIFLFGRYLLGIFGEAYARNSFGILAILVLGSIPFAFNALYVAVKRVQKEIKPVIWVYGGVAVITLVMGYVLMLEFGLIGVGYAWVIGNGVVAGGVWVRWVKRDRC